MGFLSRLLGGKGGASAAMTGDAEGFHFYVRCDRCGERIHIRANKQKDVADEWDGDASMRVLHKEILGSRCQNLMYAHLTLDARDAIVEARTERCTLISREQYEAGEGA